MTNFKWLKGIQTAWKENHTIKIIDHLEMKVIAIEWKTQWTGETAIICSCNWTVNGLKDSFKNITQNAVQWNKGININLRDREHKMNKKIQHV